MTNIAERDKCSIWARGVTVDKPRTELRGWSKNSKVMWWWGE